MYGCFTEVATVAERNHIMGHARAETFDHYYIQQIVGIDTQSAYLGTPSQDALVRLVGQMSLTRDLRAAMSVQASVTKHFHDDGNIQKQTKELEDLRWDIMSQFGSIKASRSSTLFAQYSSVQAKIRNRTQKLKKDAHRQYHQRYFAENSSREIDRQRESRPFDDVVQQPRFSFAERAVLAQVLCRNDNADKLCEQSRRETRQVALCNMISLCQHREQPPLPPPVRSNENASVAKDEPSSLPALDEKDLDCPWCFYELAFPVDTRTRSFSRLDSLRRHIEDQHLHYIDYSEGASCPFPACEAKESTEEFFRNHLATQHDLKLPKMAPRGCSTPAWMKSPQALLQRFS